jgi:heptosyltransferase-1
MRVLVVKTSSLGDIIHTLPALSDAVSVYPEMTFDWVVEEGFQEVPTWHRAVHRVIPIALRRWHKQKLFAFKNGEIQTFLKSLRQEKYDYIIDAQGLLKSTMITLLARARSKIGLSWHSARESFASLFYQKRAEVPWLQHAVVRARSLFAQGLDYSMPSSLANYGIELSRLTPFQIEDAKYYVFLHGTTWSTKHWPEAYWIELGKQVTGAGYSIQLLWGNKIEWARAQRIAAVVPKAFVVPKKLSLGEIAHLLAAATGVVAVDTGLGHLAAALGAPTVSLYGPSDPQLCGTLGERQIHLAADFPCAPCMSRTCTYQGNKTVEPPCFASLSPAMVWEQLNALRVQKVRRMSV